MEFVRRRVAPLGQLSGSLRSNAWNVTKRTPVEKIRYLIGHDTVNTVRFVDLARHLGDDPRGADAKGGGQVHAFFDVGLQFGR